MKNVLVCPIAYNENVKLNNAIERFLRSEARGSIDTSTAPNPAINGGVQAPLSINPEHTPSFRPGYSRRVDYLVVDDGSDDGTTEMIQSFASKGVQTIKHQERKGVGAGIRTAIRYAQKQGYEIIVIMAGNDKDNPDEIPRLLDPILKNGYDFVQGSRYKEAKCIGGDMPLYRKWATRLHPLLMSLFTGRKLTDTTNGFRAFRLSIVKDERIDIDQEWLNQYELEPYLLFKTIKLGYKFTEAPVTKIYPSKKLGYTKMRPWVGWWSILRPVFYLGLGIKK